MDFLTCRMLTFLASTLLFTFRYGRMSKSKTRATIQREEDLQVEKLRQKRLEEETVESKVGKIERSFLLAKSVPKHPKKPNLKPKSVVDVFPNEVLGKNSYTWVSFGDSENHAVEGKADPVQNIAINSWSSDKYGVYTENVNQSGKYAWTREYQRVPTRGVLDGDNVFFLIKPGRVDYAKYRNKMALRQHAKNYTLQRELAKRPTKIDVSRQI